MHLLRLLGLGVAAYAALAGLLIAAGYRWQSVKPRAVTAPPVSTTDSPEEGTRV